MAETLFKIPFANVPQRFEIELNGTPYIVVNRWNDSAEGGWFIDIYDANDVPLVMNIPLVAGENLIGQVAYIGLEGVLGVVTDGDDNAEATLDNLGGESNVYYLVNA